MIGELLVDLFCECRSCFVVRCFDLRKSNIRTQRDLYIFTLWIQLLEGMGTMVPSQTKVIMPEARPGQSAGRDRTQSWWDVLPAVPRCGKPCFLCGVPCNRPLGKHFIRLADDNPAHLCCQHDLHELYGE